MTRTSLSYEQRRAQILQKGRELFMTGGYESTPIQAILEALDISKGTFYHYFKSKEELLDAIVEDMTRQSLKVAESLLNDPHLSALEKFNRYFDDSAAYKYEHRALLMSMMRMMYDEQNLRLRHKAAQKRAELLSPVMARFIEQGLHEGVFHCPNPLYTAEMLVHFSSALGDMLSSQILACEHDLSVLPGLLARLEVATQTFHSLLGAAPGSLHIYRPEVVRAFFVPEPAPPQQPGEIP